MKATDKENIYNLLSKASSWAYGYKSPLFNDEIPPFEDDFEEIIELKKQESAVQSETPQAQSLQENPPAAENIQSATDSIPAADSTSPSGSKLSLLKEKIRNCSNCILSKTSALPSAGTGVENPAVLVVADAPMENASRGLEPVTGETMILLDKMLGAIALSSSVNCYITTSVKCLPPQNRAPMKDEEASCSGYLQAQIHYLKPAMILIMGRNAAQSMLETSKLINQLRGQVFDYKGTPAMVTFPPQQLIADPALKRPAWDDLKLFRAKLSQIRPDYDIPYKNKLLAGS